VALHHAEAAQAGRRADEAEVAARRATTAQAAKAAGRLCATDNSGLNSSSASWPTRTRRCWMACTRIDSSVLYQRIRKASLSGQP